MSQFKQKEGKRIVYVDTHGAVVEWLETLGYSAESRRKVERLRPGFAIQRLENSLSLIFNPAVNRYIFESGKAKAGKERDGLSLSSAVPKIQWASNLRLFGYGKPLPLNTFYIFACAQIGALVA